jgi:hypothetical protein
MDRRSLLYLAGAAVAAPLAGATAAEAAATAPRPSRVFSYERFGGFVGVGIGPLTAPRLVVYSDRTAIADATSVVRLRGPQPPELPKRAVTVLSHPANLRRKPGVPVIADAPSTRFRATGPNHRPLEGVVEALEEYRDQHAYPQPLYDLLDDALGLRAHIIERGDAYRPSAVRLVVVLIDHVDGPVKAWPAGVPVPHIGQDSRSGQADLRGGAARQVVRGIGTPPPDHGVWQAFRTPKRVLVQAAWRYLLPDE